MDDVEILVSQYRREPVRRAFPHAIRALLFVLQESISDSNKRCLRRCLHVAELHHEAELIPVIVFLDDARL